MGVFSGILLWGWWSVAIGRSAAGESGVRVVVDEYVGGLSFDVFENANRYPGPTGLLAFVAERALESLVYSELPEEVAKLHLDGVVYVHKLPYSLYIPYCSGHSVERLLRRGLKTPTITARPARHYDICGPCRQLPYSYAALL